MFDSFSSISLIVFLIYFSLIIVSSHFYFSYISYLYFSVFIIFIFSLFIIYAFSLREYITLLFSDGHLCFIVYHIYCFFYLYIYIICLASCFITFVFLRHITLLFMPLLSLFLLYIELRDHLPTSSPIITMSPDTSPPTPIG